MKITNEQDNVLQVLYNEYRPVSGDFKMDYHPYYWRPEKMQGFVEWLTRILLDNDLLVTVFDMQENGTQWFTDQMGYDAEDIGLVDVVETVGDTGSWTKTTDPNGTLDFGLVSSKESTSPQNEETARVIRGTQEEIDEYIAALKAAKETTVGD